jgi:hypothetical protein
VFTTSDDGFVDHPGARTAVIIPTPFVGPQALRNQKRMPYYPYKAAGNTDAANSTWVFTTSTDGHRGITDGANTSWVFTTSDDGFIDHPGAKTGVIIPNPLVGPQALRNMKRMPYRTYRALGNTDAANSTWTFSFSTQGVRGASDGANLVIDFTTSDDGFVDHKGAKTSVQIPNPFVGPQALRVHKRMPYVGQSIRLGVGISDGANQTLAFNASTDGYVFNLGDIPLANIVIVSPNETRTVSLTPGAWTVIVSPNEVRVEQVTQEAWTTLVAPNEMNIDQVYKEL